MNEIPNNVIENKENQEVLEIKSNKPFQSTKLEVTTSDSTSTTEEFKFSTNPSLEKLRSIQSTFVRERGWNKFQVPRNLLLALVNEVGELAEIFQWKGEVESGIPDWPAKEKEHLGEELSDVFIYLMRLAEECHVDLPKVAASKIEKNKLKYPIEKFYGTCKKYND